MEYGLGEVNVEEGKSILEFSSPFDLTIANTYVRKRDAQLITQEWGDMFSNIGRDQRKYRLKGEEAL